MNSPTVSSLYLRRVIKDDLVVISERLLQGLDYEDLELIFMSVANAPDIIDEQLKEFGSLERVTFADRIDRKFLLEVSNVTKYDRVAKNGKVK